MAFDPYALEFFASGTPFTLIYRKHGDAFSGAANKPRHGTRGIGTAFCASMLAVRCSGYTSPICPFQIAHLRQSLSCPSLGSQAYRLGSEACLLGSQVSLAHSTSFGAASIIGR